MLHTICSHSKFSVSKRREETMEVYWYSTFWLAHHWSNITVLGLRNVHILRYASGNNLRGTLHGSRKKLNTGRSPTRCLWTANANSHMPCHAHATLCHGLEKSLSERGCGMAWARYRMCESNTATLRKSINHLVAWHGRGNSRGIVFCFPYSWQ
jgi:hypothetical protein